MSRYSANDAGMLAALAESALALANQGESAEAATVLRTCGILIADGHALPPKLARWLAQRLHAAADEPFRVPLFERSAAQARGDGEHWRRFNEARAAWLAVQATPRASARTGGGRTEAIEAQAKDLGITVRQLRERWRAYGIVKPRSAS